MGQAYRQWKSIFLWWQQKSLLGLHIIICLLKFSRITQDCTTPSYVMCIPLFQIVYPAVLLRKLSRIPHDCTTLSFRDAHPVLTGFSSRALTHNTPATNRSARNWGFPLWLIYLGFEKIPFSKMGMRVLISRIYVFSFQYCRLMIACLKTLVSSHIFRFPVLIVVFLSSPDTPMLSLYATHIRL